jgi:hypothetical protein
MSIKEYRVNQTKIMGDGTPKVYTYSVNKMISGNKIPGRPKKALNNREEIIEAFKECQNKERVCQRYDISRYLLTNLLKE